MHSLRARLLAIVLALTAAGLLLLGGITYVGQRSFLLDQLDDQIELAPPAAAGALGLDGGGRPPRGEGGPPPGSGLPPGTYVEHRTASGTVDASQVFTYGQDITADPALPSDIPVGRAFTVEGAGGDDARYRVYAEA